MEDSEASKLFETGSTQSNLVYQLVDPSNYIDKIEHLLRGEKQMVNESGVIVWNKRFDPMMNEKGISAVLRIINCECNENTILSNYTEERIMIVLMRTMQLVNISLGSNYQEYGIKPSEFKLIVSIIGNMLESTYRRSIGGGTLKEIMKNTQTRAVTQEISDSRAKDGGVLGMFKR